MHLSKSKILPIAGMVALLFFIMMSYVNDSILLDRILICSLILSMIFISKIRSNNYRTISNPKDRTDQILSK
jgi:hypothetical protein